MLADMEAVSDVMMGLVLQEPNAPFLPAEVPLSAAEDAALNVASRDGNRPAFW